MGGEEGVAVTEIAHDLRRKRAGEKVSYPALKERIGLSKKEKGRTEILRVT